MGEYIFNRGRSKTAHGYPDTRSGANGPSVSSLARNFALGPALESSVSIGTAGTLVPWASIESGAPAGTDVPITPQVSGIVNVRGVITLRSSSSSAETVQIQIVVNGSPLLVPTQEVVAVPSSTELEGDWSFVIPFEVDVNVTTNGALLPLATVANISVLLTALADSVISLVDLSSTISVQEVIPATG